MSHSAPSMRKRASRFRPNCLIYTGVRKKTILFVTHDLDEAVLIADRVLWL